MKSLGQIIREAANDGDFKDSRELAEFLAPGLLASPYALDYVTDLIAGAVPGKLHRSGKRAPESSATSTQGAPSSASPKLSARRAWANDYLNEIVNVPGKGFTRRGDLCEQDMRDIAAQYRKLAQSNQTEASRWEALADALLEYRVARYGDLPGTEWL